MAMKRYSAFSKAQAYWNLTTRLFSVISRTLIGVGFHRLAEMLSVYSATSSNWASDSKVSELYSFLCNLNDNWYITLSLHIFIKIVQLKGFVTIDFDYIYIYIYIYANFIKHNRHFMPTYFFLELFKFPYYFYRIRGELI